MKNKTKTWLNYELYTKGPKGQLGWDIATGSVFAASRAEAKEMLRKQFGCLLDDFISVG